MATPYRNRPKRAREAPPLARLTEARNRSKVRGAANEETQGIVWLGVFVSLASVCIVFIIAALGE